MVKKNNFIFNESFFRLFDSVKVLISKIIKEVKTEDYYNSDHLLGPIDSFNQDALETITDLICLRKKLSLKAFRDATSFALQLADLYESDSKKGKEAILFLLQLFDGQEIKHIRHAVINKVKRESTRMKIAEDFKDVLLFGRILHYH